MLVDSTPPSTKYHASGFKYIISPFLYASISFTNSFSNTSLAVLEPSAFIAASLSNTNKYSGFSLTKYSNDICFPWSVVAPSYKLLNPISLLIKDALSFELKTCAEPTDTIASLPSANLAILSILSWYSFSISEAVSSFSNTEAISNTFSI